MQTVGRINLRTVPVGVTVFVDGVFFGTTPLEAVALSAGTREVRLVYPNFEAMTEQVVVESGQTLIYEFRLTAIENPNLNSGNRVNVERPVERVITENKQWSPEIEEVRGIRMVKVPAGSFRIGSEDGDSDEKNGNDITFEEPYWIDETEVSREAYEACIKAGVCSATATSNYSTSNNQPINSVTWYQAGAYCEWRGTRLPTEAEWEYAARGPDRLTYPWGNSFDSNRANSWEASVGQTSDVKGYREGASWVGALNMSGNLREWTSTLKRDYPYNANDGREIKNYNSSISNSIVIRGGSFNDTASALRAANRDAHEPDVSDYDIGFRCTRSNSDF